MSKKLKWTRALIITFYVACSFFVAYILIKNPIKNNIYGFLIHSESKIHCPSCGLTRAVYCIFHLDFKGAFYYHALFTMLLPLLIYIVLTLTINLFSGKKIIPYPKHFGVYLYVLLGLYVTFGILRNFIPNIY